MVSDLLVQGFGLVVALASVLSEHKLARGKLNGWIWAVIASVLTGIFFLTRERTILALVEILNVPFSIYGFFKWKRCLNKITKTDSFMVYSAIIVIIVYFFCKETENHGNIQMITASMFLIGGLLIARGKKLGWCMCIVADVLLMYVLLESNDYVFICFQVASICISVRKTLKKSTGTLNTTPTGSCFKFNIKEKKHTTDFSNVLFALCYFISAASKISIGKVASAEITLPLMLGFNPADSISSFVWSTSHCMRNCTRKQILF